MEAVAVVVVEQPRDRVAPAVGETDRLRAWPAAMGRQTPAVVVVVQVVPDHRNHRRRVVMEDRASWWSRM
jgi:hypothetical protein